VGDAGPRQIARLQGLAGQPVQAALVALQLAALPLRVAVELVELLAGGDHLGQRRGSRPAPIGSAGPLQYLPLEEEGRVAQDSRGGQRGPRVYRWGLPRGAPERAGRDPGCMGCRRRVALRGRADAKDRGHRARAPRRREAEQSPSGPAPAVGGAAGGEDSLRHLYRAAAAELQAHVGGADRGAERLPVFPAGDQGSRRRWGRRGSGRSIRRLAPGSGRRASRRTRPGRALFSRGGAYACPQLGSGKVTGNGSLFHRAPVYGRRRRPGTRTRPEHPTRPWRPDLEARPNRTTRAEVPGRGARSDGLFGEGRPLGRGSYQWAPGPRVDPDTGTAASNRRCGRFRGGS